MNKNLRLLLWISLISGLGAILFAVDSNGASAATWYGYWYGYWYSSSSNGGSVGGTYTYTLPGTIISTGGQVVPISTIVDNWTPTVITPNTPMIVTLSNGGGSTTTLPTTDTTNPVFVLPNTGVN